MSGLPDLIPRMSRRVPHPDDAVCDHCERPIYQLLNEARDPGGRYYHVDSGNGFCSVRTRSGLLSHTCALENCREVATPIEPRPAVCKHCGVRVIKSRFFWGSPNAPWQHVAPTGGPYVVYGWCGVADPDGALAGNYAEVAE